MSGVLMILPHSSFLEKLWKNKLFSCPRFADIRVLIVNPQESRTTLKPHFIMNKNKKHIIFPWTDFPVAWLVCARWNPGLAAGLQVWLALWPGIAVQALHWRGYWSGWYKIRGKLGSTLRSRVTGLIQAGLPSLKATGCKDCPCIRSNVSLGPWKLKFGRRKGYERANLPLAVLNE